MLHETNTHLQLQCFTITCYPFTSGILGKSYIQSIKEYAPKTQSCRCRVGICSTYEEDEDGGKPWIVTQYQWPHARWHLIPTPLFRLGQSSQENSPKPFSNQDAVVWNGTKQEAVDCRGTTSCARVARDVPSLERLWDGKILMLSWELRDAHTHVLRN